jgi:hypothetical protein
MTLRMRFRYATDGYNRFCDWTPGHPTPLGLGTRAAEAQMRRRGKERGGSVQVVESARHLSFEPSIGRFDGARALSMLRATLTG